MIEMLQKQVSMGCSTLMLSPWDSVSMDAVTRDSFAACDTRVESVGLGPASRWPAVLASRFQCVTGTFGQSNLHHTAGHRTAAARPSVLKVSQCLLLRGLQQSSGSLCLQGNYGMSCNGNREGGEETALYQALSDRMVLSR